MMSSCIIAAQLVMLPIALLVGRTADIWGRKTLFLAGFAILPIRAVLYTLSDNSFWLIGVQLLDGVGAGVFGALTPLVIADIMRGTGRYNLAQGAIATVHGIGASLSGLAAGVIVDRFGYSSAFLGLAAAAAAALTVFALGMPETADRRLRLLEHKQALFDHLVGRWRDLFNISFDVLLYALSHQVKRCLQVLPSLFTHFTSFNACARRR
jgi:MFS family permease